MTGIKTKLSLFGLVGALGIWIASALGADATDIARETFQQTAKEWGIWAAVCIGLIMSAVVGLVVLVRFVITTMRDCIDDNTLSHLHLARVFSHRPCLHDSDAIPDLRKIEETDGPIGDTGRRVLARRAKRETRPT